MSEVREVANKIFRKCKEYPSDKSTLEWLLGFLACAEIANIISHEEIEAALKRLDK